MARWPRSPVALFPVAPFPRLFPVALISPWPRSPVAPFPLALFPRSPYSIRNGPRIGGRGEALARQVFKDDVESSVKGVRHRDGRVVQASLHQQAHSVDRVQVHR